MLKVGLTGGMACGKSVVGAMFADLGAHVADADRIAHELMRPGEAVYEEIVGRFGRDILASDGTIDRPRLAAKAFGALQAGTSAQGPGVEELNRIVHPAVIRRQEEWIDEIGRREPGAVAIVEAALIFEAGVERRFDRIVVVTCDAEQKIQRLASRTGVDIETARREMERRSSAQLSDTEKARRADYVIDNSGSRDATAKQAVEVYGELKREAERR